MKCKCCGGYMGIKEVRTYSVGKVSVDTSQISEVYVCKDCNSTKVINTYSKNKEVVDKKEVWYK